MITLDQVSVTYPDATRPALRDVSLDIPAGELCLVIGRTGSGKSTLLRCVNGLTPTFTGGTLSGRVTVVGRDTRTHPPRELADVVGFVGQDPMAGFVTDTVEEELAYGMEQLAVPADVMRKRVEEALDVLGLAELRYRPLNELSAGQQQRVAIGSALATQVEVLLLDEPTSALDPPAAEEVLAGITRLVHDLGLTVLMAEHRLERVVQYADRMIEVRPDGTVRVGPPADVLADADIAPPIVELGRTLDWHPLPLSVRDARRLAAPARERLAQQPASVSPTPASTPNPVALRASNLMVRYGHVVAVRGVDVALHAGEITALMGRNGSGKSSLLWALQGSGPRQGGSVEVAGADPALLPAGKARSLVGLVPQAPTDLLFLDTVADELAEADRESAAAVRTAAAILDRLAAGIDRQTHPRDLSEGQRLALVLAIQLTAAPQIVLLDEPTRGLDYPGKAHLTAVLAELADAGHAVLVSTHDVEFAAAVAHRVVVMAQGDVIADGAALDVLVASAAFAPQVAKILAPLPYLTVADVRSALAATQR
jgi:energy-coupling factor transport system ATP-binding protein